MAIVTNKPRRIWAHSWTIHSTGLAIHIYFRSPFFGAGFKKTQRPNGPFSMLQVIGHQCHILSPHVHHFTRYWFPPLVSLYSPVFHIYIPYMEAFMTSPILFLRWIDGSVTRCDGFQTGGYPANSRGGPSNSQPIGC